eukprot:CAMPEP_0206620016 /NCGR_PEP_ID=MMETSP0325_2-20121206/61315_1 /ASSEMBLY_ACC=CAM_ASM_000347 /TAXON_ID=2866 /ORGANISM="Crypthecodinium cohnii, Strain Seligo" /LENGTH=40 /DNA_ID= /DNA_START= /DNA_END= /DNA_ORIENTATION=
MTTEEERVVKSDRASRGGGQGEAKTLQMTILRRHSSSWEL